MRALGIEGTAHTISVGIVEERRGRCEVLGLATKMHLPGAGKGIHPREAADHHAENVGALVEQALQAANLDPRDLDLIAFSRGPGMGPCLRTAATAARALSLTLDKPILGVNHCVAHLEIGLGTTAAKDPIMLYVSGANTQVIGEALGRYRVFGETLDIGVGNGLDKFARERGLPFPGGPEVEKLARSGKTLVPLPYSVKGMDVSFSGILTAAEQLAQQGTPVGDLCFSLQETCFAMLTEVTERALAHAGKDEVLLGGGKICAWVPSVLEVVEPALGAQVREPHAAALAQRVETHRLEQVGALVGDGLERGARQVRARGAARQAHDRAARVRVPVRRAKAGEGGHDVDAAVVENCCRHCFYFS
jgi:glycoprotease/Kae1 family metallohydrolase